MHSRSLALATAVVLALVGPSPAARAQVPAHAIRSLTPDEVTALRPLAQRGAAVVVRNPAGGAAAQITVLVRARAPLETVRNVIAAPEQYPAFMRGITSMEVTARHQGRIGFRFHVAVAIFDVTTVAMLHVVSPQRIDGALIQSELGPGGLRWDLAPDGDGTLIAYTTWGDPTQGNWFLRQLARQEPSAIAGMQISYDVMLALATGRRAEILTGQHEPARPAAREVAPGPLEPPAAGPWESLTRDAIVGAIVLDANGAFAQTTVASWVPAPLATQRARLERVEDYARLWPAFHALRLVGPPRADGAQRFSSVLDDVLGHTDGEQDRVVEAPTARGTTAVWWRGVSGGCIGAPERWDLEADASGGTVVMLTGGSEQARAGLVARGIVGSDTWMLPGFAAAWKIAWMRPLLAGP